MPTRFRVLMAMLLLASTGSAATVTYTMTAGGKSAAASFETLQNGMLQVTLSNTALNKAASVDDVLTGIYFGLSPLRVLDPLSAGVVNAGSLVNCPGCGTNVGGEWAYRGGVSNLTTMGAASVISASDLGGLLGTSDRFANLNLAGTRGVGGTDFGILPTSGALNGSALASMPLTIGTTVFVFNPGQQFSLANVTFAGFLYGQSGTGYSGVMQGNFWSSDVLGTPEPGSFAMLGLGLMGLGIAGRRRKAR